MSSLLLAKRFRLQSVIPEPVFILRDIIARPEYKDGKRTDIVLGYYYHVVNTESFDSVRILVEQSNPLMTREALQQLIEEGEKVFVEFENAWIKAYFSTRNNSYEDNITAEDVRLVEG